MWYIQKNSGNSYHDVLNMPLTAILDIADLMKEEQDKMEKQMKKRRR